MPAPKGNQYWKARAKHGRDHIYSADELLAEAEAYFDRLTNQKAARFYDPISKKHFLRPPSIYGFCVHLGIGERTWYAWQETRADDEDFMQVISYIETMMRVQQFDGAAIGFFKGNIMSRAIGLAQKHEHSGPGGAPIPVEAEELSPDELARRLTFAFERAQRGGTDGAGEGSDGEASPGGDG